MSEQKNSNVAGVLSGIAAIITAFGGIYVAMQSTKNPTTTPSVSSPSDALMTSSSSNKEQEWQRYYKGCGGDYQSFERTFRDSFEKTWRETGARPRGCG
jgi:hypothetical protein